MDHSTVDANAHISFITIIVQLPHAVAHTSGLEPHRLQGAVAGEDDQVGPGGIPVVLLLDRPEQEARLVEFPVVRLAVEGRKELVAGAATTLTVADAVCAWGVPFHVDEEQPIVAKVGWSPVL